MPIESVKCFEFRVLLLFTLYLLQQRKYLLLEKLPLSLPLRIICNNFAANKVKAEKCAGKCNEIFFSLESNFFMLKTYARGLLGSTHLVAWLLFYQHCYMHTYNSRIQAWGPIVSYYIHTYIGGDAFEHLGSASPWYSSLFGMPSTKLISLLFQLQKYSRLLTDRFGEIVAGKFRRITKKNRLFFFSVFDNFTEHIGFSLKDCVVALRILRHF